MIAILPESQSRNDNGIIIGRLLFEFFERHELVLLS